jgi:hypothetical protein
MRKSTLEALEKSVKKWKQNVRRVKEGMHLTTGRKECPLCVLFNSATDDKHQLGCRGCPVYKDTKCAYCACTPFTIVFDTNDPSNRIDEEDRQELLLAACKDELNYLKSLLPKSKK